MRWRALSLGDRLSALRLATGAARRPPARRRGGRRATCRARQTVSAWLAAHGQSPRLCEWLWHPLAIAALNQSPEVAAAAPFVRVLGELFGPRPRTRRSACRRVPLDELYARAGARDIIEARGGRVLTKSPARVALDAHGASQPACGPATTRSRRRAVVSACRGTRSPASGRAARPRRSPAVAANAAAMASSPIVTVNLWFDGPVHARAVRRPHRRPDALGVRQERDLRRRRRAPVDRLERRRCDRRDWTTPSSRALAVATDRAGAARGSRRAGSCGRSSSASTARRFRSRRARRRGPATATPLPGFYLAGDWTDTGLPATIEGAVAERPSRRGRRARRHRRRPSAIITRQ